MKTVPLGVTALILGTIACVNCGCTSTGKTVTDPAGSAIYRDGEWQPIDTSKFRQVPSEGPSGYYDDHGIWHAVR